MREAGVVDHSCRWLEAEGRQTKLEVAWVDATATRGGDKEVLPPLVRVVGAKAIAGGLGSVVARRRLRLKDRYLQRRAEVPDCDGGSRRVLPRRGRVELVAVRDGWIGQWRNLIGDP
jgi:hypothetical protein